MSGEEVENNGVGVQAGDPFAFRFCLENNVQVEWEFGHTLGRNEKVGIAGEVMDPFPL